MRSGWKVYGPYENGDGRRMVVLKRGRESTSLAYAKWVLEQKLGRTLSREEQADHIDEDCRNDDPSNLQILTQLENIRKSHVGAETYDFDCPMCGNPASKPAKDVRHNRNLGRAGPFCGRVCARSWQIENRPPTRTKEVAR